MGRRRRTILTFALAAAAGCGLPWGGSAHAQQPQEPAPGQVPPPAVVPTTRPATTRPAVADVEGDLKALEAILLQPDARPADRDEAAARLESRNVSDAEDRLRTVLTGDAPRDAKLAVARAVADDPSPSDSLIAPLGELLRAGAEQKSTALVDAAAQALANYRRSAAALDELLRFAQDARQTPEMRARVIRVLGRVVEPAVADLLVRLLGNEKPQLRAAAADALAELTGIRDNGQDVRRWTQWRNAAAANARDNPDRWRADLLDLKAQNLERLRRRHDALAAAVEARMLQRYRDAVRDQKGAETLLSFLTSELPDERAIAARLVTGAFRNSDPLTERVRERLVSLVGDSDPAVRYEVAVTLTNLNYKPALGAELTQLAQEREERVRLALVEALGRIEDPAAAPQLAGLLGDPSPRVVAAAANALARTGRTLRETSPTLWDRATERLRAIAEGKTGAGAELRGAALDALAALQDPGLVELAQRLLAGNPPEPAVPVRLAVLKALGALGDGAAADLVTRTLRDARDPELRAAALDALGRVGNVAEHGGQLLDLTKRENEPDEALRGKAWDAYQALLPRANATQLALEQANLRNDPVRRSVVLEELCRKLEASPRPEDKANLATFREDLGGVYMQQKPPLPERAIVNYRRALDYYIQAKAGEDVTTPLVQKLMEAYLKFKDYAAATRFAQEMIKLDPRNQVTVGPLIKNEADRLRLAGDTPSAQLLIAEALKMDPPLEQRHVTDLQQIRKEISPGQ